MIVVVIIGIQATLSYSSLEDYLQHSKQTETKVCLSAVNTAQKSISQSIKHTQTHLVNWMYKLETGGSFRYAVTLTGSGASFTANAKGNLDDDVGVDI